MKKVLFLSVIVASFTLSPMATAATTWLSGKVTADGVAVSGANCWLGTSSWGMNKYFTYESAITDANGEFSFKTVDNPTNGCYTTYSYSSTKYCSYNGAYCQCHCQETDGRICETTGYEITCSPPWGSDIASRFGQTTVKNVTVDFSGTQNHTIVLTKKDKTLTVCLQDMEGNPITSGFDLNVSGPNWSSATINNTTGCHDFLVAAGTYYASGYCTKWDDCSVSCINSATVEMKSEDTSKSVTLKAKRNDSTLEVTVTDPDSNPISGASVNISNWEYMDHSSGAAAPAMTTSCGSYANGTTDSTGKVTLKSTASQHTLNVWPPYNMITHTSGSNYASATIPVTLAKGETTKKRVVLKKKDSAITATCRDSNGTALEQCSVNLWSNSDTFNDWGWGQTDSSGKATINAVKGVRYSRSCWYSTYGANQRSDLGSCPTEGQVTVEAPAEVTCTFPVYTSTCHYSFVDLSGNALPQAQGSLTIYPAGVQAKNDDWSYPMCSEWASLYDGGSAIRPCPTNTAMKVEAWTWQGQYDSSGAYAFTTGAANTITYVKIPLKPVNAKIRGKFLDQDGNDASPGSSYSYVSCTRDNLWKGCTMESASSFSCDVSAGKWWCGCRLDYQSQYAPAPTGSGTASVEVADSQTADLNLRLLKKATIKVKVEDHLGNAKKWVWVTAAACSAETDSSNRMYYGGSGCSTNAEGRCSITVGAADAGTEYCLFPHLSWNDRFKEGLTLPEKVPVTCKAGETCEGSPLVFRQMDGEFKIQVRVSGTVSSASISLSLSKSSETSVTDVAKKAFVSGYSSKCDSVEAETDDNGVAIIPCVGGDRYQFAAMNQIGNTVYVSEAVELECLSNTMTVSDLYLTEAGSIPSAASKVCKDTDPCSATLSDGLSVSLPRNACGKTGNEIVLKVQPTVTLPLQCEARPVGLYGYDITVTGADGENCTKLQSDATVCMPLDDDFLAALGLTSQDCSMTYLDRATDTYQQVSGAILNIEKLVICGTIYHLTEFVVVGKGNIKAIDGDVEGSAEQAARTSEVSGATGVTESVQGEWGQGVGVDVGDVSDSGEVAGGGNIGGIDSVPISVPTSAGGGGFFGCTLVPSP